MGKKRKKLKIKRTSDNDLLSEWQKFQKERTEKTDGRKSLTK